MDSPPLLSTRFIKKFLKLQLSPSLQNGISVAKRGGYKNNPIIEAKVVLDHCIFPLRLRSRILEHAYPWLKFPLNPSMTHALPAVPSGDEWGDGFSGVGRKRIRLYHRTWDEWIRHEIELTCNPDIKE